MVQVGNVVKWANVISWVTDVSGSICEIHGYSNIPIDEVEVLEYDFFIVDDFELPVSAVYEEGADDPLIFMVHLKTLAKMKYSLN